MFKRKSFYIVLIAAIILICGFIVFAEGSREKVPSEEADFTAVVDYAEGSVLIDGKQASIGQTVDPGATIETGEDSYCDIVFGKYNVFRVEPDTITSVSIGPDRRDITLSKGAVGAVFDKLKTLSGVDRDFTVKTPSMVAGVRGTVFYVNVENPDTTYLCTCHGEIHQETADGGIEQDVEAYHHKAYRFTKTEKGIEVTEGTLLYHDDASMNAIAAGIDVIVPWGKAPKN